MSEDERQEFNRLKIEVQTLRELRAKSDATAEVVMNGAKLHWKGVVSRIQREKAQLSRELFAARAENYAKHFSAAISRIEELEKELADQMALSEFCTKVVTAMEVAGNAISEAGDMYSKWANGPLSFDGAKHTSHFATCPDAAEHRKVKL